VTPPSSYGRLGRIGLGTPQANPTVEAEFAILLPRACTTLVTRLTSPATEPADRLRAYIERLDEALARYDSLEPDAFGFACTGSSYLVGPEREAELVEGFARAFGYPIVTATGAIRWALDRIGARRVGIVAPYPADLLEAGRAYWRAAGVEVVAIERVVTRTADTRTIYELGFASAIEKVADMADRRVDAVLLSGTGMPSLPLIAAAGGTPVLSSNLALAGCLVERLRPGTLAPDTIGPPGWRDRLAEALA